MKLFAIFVFSVHKAINKKDKYHFIYVTSRPTNVRML